MKHKEEYMLIYRDWDGADFPQAVVFDTEHLVDKYLKEHNIELSEGDKEGWVLIKIKRICNEMEVLEHK